MIALSVSPGVEFYADMNIPVMRAAMLGRIGFSEQAARVLVEDQGINSLVEIRVQSDDKIESCPEERFLHATGPPLDPRRSRTVLPSPSGRCLGVVQWSSQTLRSTTFAAFANIVSTNPPQVS